MASPLLERGELKGLKTRRRRQPSGRPWTGHHAPTRLPLCAAGAHRPNLPRCVMELSALAVANAS
jgi:hypothetical protein